MDDYRSEVDCSSLLKQGAEAKIYTGVYLGKLCIIKERFPKKYRHPALELSLSQQRTKSEVRSMLRCRTQGIQTPAVFFVNTEENKIYMEYVNDSVTVRDYIIQVQSSSDDAASSLLKPLAYKIGEKLGKMHNKNIIHGDLTTSNMLLRKPVENLDIVLIDFGLSYINSTNEDKGVDLYVLERAFLSTHPNTESLFSVLLDGYQNGYRNGVGDVVRKLNEVRLRGRKRTMVG
ncbi:hypothetical protein LSH36_323g02018 [Paralvinella palmiformis]|uniref:non-specific serine/threonine protein kinase n=1 Tax=Paralvinella palmiformis TaxID=53620 RepID=A0AAD9JHN3_9ANNE|nr:hypothetical protein LSH36_323g02018 [Paralvinella palmiformis]